MDVMANTGGPAYRDLLILPLRKKLRKESGVGVLGTVSNMRCIICNAYPCRPRMITPEENGGDLTGDNLLPICSQHSKVNIIELWCNHQQIHQWLLEHERIDAIALLDQIRVQLRYTKAY
jgi:hypothetical protein